MLPHVPDLMEVIIARLSDPAVVKRDAALHTLGQVCSSTGYVITPLVDYPQLLPVLSRILRTETTLSVRREVIKVLGILGALDPYRRKVSLSNVQCHPRPYISAAQVPWMLTVCLFVRANQSKRPRTNWRTLRCRTRSPRGPCPVLGRHRTTITRPWPSTRCSAFFVINRRRVSTTRLSRLSCQSSRRKG